MSPLKLNHLLILSLAVSLGVGFRLGKFNNSSIFKVFGQPQVSVSKFPPFVEYFVQRIQAHFSTYAHEDLSRPPTWDKPVYTLSPEDQQFFNASTPTSDIDDDVEIIDRTSTESPTTEADLGLGVGNSTEVLFGPNGNKTPDEFEYEELEETSEKLFEIISGTTKGSRNKTFVYITPKTTYKPVADKDRYEKTTEKGDDAELEINITLKYKNKKAVDKFAQLLKMSTTADE